MGILKCGMLPILLVAGPLIPATIQADPLDQLTQRIAKLEAKVAALEGNSVHALDGRLTYDDKTMTAQFSGVNGQVVNGLNITHSINGLGNLIVGYNGENPYAPNNRSGSHNLVVGDEHTYTRFGGFAAGHGNSITGEWASVSGGRQNVARGIYSSVSGGYHNSAQAYYASVSGGANNKATHNYSSVSGGKLNTADRWGA